MLSLVKTFRLLLLPASLGAVVLALACAADSEPEPEPESDAEPAGQPTGSSGGASSGPKQYSAPPPMVIDPSKSYTATIEMEKGGEVVIDLAADKAPKTVNNFVFLAREGYYDGITFHRVIPGFMAQSGDPTGTGGGGPGYRFENEFHTDLRHDSPGVISMANAGIRNGEATNGSQFFITYTETSYLDGLNPDGSPKDCAARGVSCHSVFGRVARGMDVLLEISPRDPSTARTPGDVIKSITIDER